MVCRLSLNLMHASTAHLVVAAAAVVAGDRKTAAAAAANSALPHSLTHCNNSYVGFRLRCQITSSAFFPSFLPSLLARGGASFELLLVQTRWSVGRSVCKFNEKFDVVRRAVAGEICTLSYLE